MEAEMKAKMALVAGVALLLASTRAGRGAETAPVAAPQARPLTGDVALWTMAIKADKTSDFEAVMTKLRDGLTKSAKPERRQQAAGWRVLKVPQPMPDGTVAYVHVINPVVPNADYTIM